MDQLVMLTLRAVTFAVATADCLEYLPGPNRPLRSSLMSAPHASSTSIINNTDAYFARRKEWSKRHSLTPLGRHLFLGEKLQKPQIDKDFKILLWKHGKEEDKRHIFYFSSARHNPFENCSVSNCRLAYEEDDIEDSDAVIIFLQLTTPEDLPQASRRRPSQRWIFVTDESPHNVFLVPAIWQDFDDVFNWSMSYRMESDVPVPYGRTLAHTAVERRDASRMNIMDLVPNARQKNSDVLVTILISNCRDPKDARMKYLNELKKYINVDVYGACGPHKGVCPGAFTADCPIIDKYWFYLAFENSLCSQYLTEKVWYNAFGKGSIPVIVGVEEQETRLLLPPGSYLHTANFSRPADLARYIIYLNESRTALYRYHVWRRFFSVVSEHGYFHTPSRHYCRLCEALNYNVDEAKIYGRRRLANFLSISDNCYQQDDTLWYA